MNSAGFRFRTQRRELDALTSMNTELRRADDDAMPIVSTFELRSEHSGDPRVDAHLLFGVRFIRMFAFGCCTVALLLLLAEIGLDGGQIGLLLSLVMAGDLVITLLLATSADSCGRRRVLICGAFLALIGATALCSTDNFTLLVLAVSAL